MGVCELTAVRRACAAFLCLAIAFVAAPLPAAPDTTAEVEKLTKARQESVKSLDVKLKLTEVLSAGARAPGNKAFPMIPKERTAVTSEARLVIQGSNFRYEDNMGTFDMDGNVFHRSLIFVADGAVAKRLYPNGMSDNGYPSAMIDKQDQRAGRAAHVAWPLLAAFRGLDASLADGDVLKSKPTDVTELLSGVPCRRFDLERQQYKQMFWIDESGQLRGSQSESNGKLSMRSDVHYERRFGVDSFPVSWKWVYYSKAGAVQREWTVEVVEATVNQPIVPTEFEVTFPPGCDVHDEIAHKTYVVQPDGGLAERDPPRKEGGVPSFYRWLIGACLAILLVLIVIACLHRLRRDQKPTPPKPA